MSPWHVRGGLPCEESHSCSRVHSLPWGLSRMTNGPLTITSPVRISMEGSSVRGISGGGNIGFLACHFPPLRHLWNIVAESNLASKYASNGTWMNPVARRELSKPVDGRANSSPSLSNGVKESRPVRTWALFFWGRQVESGSRAISKRSRFLSVGNCQRMARKSFPHPKEAKKDEKWQKEVPGGGFFNFEPQRVDGSGRNFHRASRRHRCTFCA